MRLIKLTADRPESRADKYIAQELSEFSRSFLKGLFEDGLITLNGKAISAKTKICAGDVIEFSVPDPEQYDVEPENIPINIVYEDDDIAVINKPQGMVVHPAPGNYSGTLVNALMYHLSGLSGINGVMRPGIVHRIDKDTSGLIVVAKNDDAHRSLAEQIKSKEAGRTYIALVHGYMKQKEGTISLPIARHRTDRKRMAVDINGREAVTDYSVKEVYKGYSLVEARLRTGRTHQIRVHFSHMGHGVVGDPVYGKGEGSFKLNGQLLHASRLALTHPRTGERITFFAPLPDYFKNVLNLLEDKID